MRESQEVDTDMGTTGTLGANFYSQQISQGERLE